jgi:hypothetical protein
MQQHGVVRNPFPLAFQLPRLRPLLLAPVLSTAMLLGPGSAHAAPATQEEMGLYTRIAAVNVCISRAAGVEFDKAVAIAGETIAQLILGQHDGQIQQVGTKKLSIEELRKGSVNSAVIGAAEICPNEVPADVKKRVDDALKSTGSQAR